MATVLIIGSGGREHALAWKLAQSPKVSALIMAPGNDGWVGLGKPVTRWQINDFSSKESLGQLAAKARAAGVDLAVIGPDDPLADGIVDIFSRYGILSFGPTAAAAKIESSKAFAKDVMKAAGVPTAKHYVAHCYEDAYKLLRELPWDKDGGWVIKADGLALGKGVCVCATAEEALLAVEMLSSMFGSEEPFVIEERLYGEELSWMAFCDGERCALLEPARDYKRLLDGDKGPNTGGMGAFSPVPWIPESYAERVRRDIFIPTLKEMKKRGAPFRGLLYAGLMVDLKNDKIWVLEFNARFGDPETQVLMARLSDDLFVWCDAVARGDISGLPKGAKFSPESAVVVIAASKGYPGSPKKGERVNYSAAGDITAPDYFMAGVRTDKNLLITHGGRVLGAMGVGASLEAASKIAYGHLSKVSFKDMHFRTDIGTIAGNK
ncbi:MAG: phosphoribosylamine--glycine ligase [Bdellovibrionota bacterium]